MVEAQRDRLGLRATHSEAQLQVGVVLRCVTCHTLTRRSHRLNIFAFVIPASSAEVGPLWNASCRSSNRRVAPDVAYNTRRDRLATAAQGTRGPSDGPNMLPEVPYSLIDLFAGCGGMTRGFSDTGRFTPVFAVEMDRDAAATYAANFGEDHVYSGQIQDVGVFPSADVVIGGPPCQGFSPLNRNGVGGERRALWREYLRALDQADPRAFVMENVPELLVSQEYKEFRAAARKRGFSVQGTVLNAADYGVPQRRRRAIVIGVQEGAPPWPAPTHSSPDVPVLGTKPWLTFRQAVDGLPLRPTGDNWHNPRNPRPESVRRYKAVPRDGGDRFSMQANLDRAGLGHLVPDCWRNKPTGTTDVFGRLWWDRPAFTIRTEFFKPEKGRYLHPSAHRPITLREAARCMSFADDFEFPLDQSMTSVARQIGNAVPPTLARQIANEIADHLDAAGVESKEAERAAA
jgi:DNA (cytosine-5)-methyltransferase 1